MVVLQWVCACGQRHDAAQDFRVSGPIRGRTMPQAGDVLMCRGCGEAHRFQEHAAPARLAWPACLQLLLLTGQFERFSTFARSRAIIRGQS